mgnify:CR=1 FL=1|tara:strand:- start:238 stop:462 length:225 start_codon:yes stop_codon:yes gene_type:complete
MRNKNSKTATIVTTYSADLGLVLNWLLLNKAIVFRGDPYETKRGLYASRVKSKVSKKELSSLVKDRFGIFAKVL